MYKLNSQNSEVGSPNFQLNFASDFRLPTSKFTKVTSL